MIRDGFLPCDVAFVQVSPADKDGNSYGLINDFVQEAVANARVVIAEVSDRVPFTHGDAMLSQDHIDVAVHVSRLPVTVAAALIGPQPRRSEVNVIITEYGAAELRGQSLAERARRLVAIAHPDQRAALDEAAPAIARRGYWCATTPFCTRSRRKGSR